MIKAGTGRHDPGVTPTGAVSDDDRASMRLDRKTVRRDIERGLGPPADGPRKPPPTLLDPFTELSSGARSGVSGAERIQVMVP